MTDRALGRLFTSLVCPCISPSFLWNIFQAHRQSTPSVTLQYLATLSDSVRLPVYRGLSICLHLLVCMQHLVVCITHRLPHRLPRHTLCTPFVFLYTRCVLPSSSYAHVVYSLRLPIHMLCTPFGFLYTRCVLTSSSCTLLPSSSYTHVI